MPVLRHPCALVGLVLVGATLGTGCLRTPPAGAQRARPERPSTPNDATAARPGFSGAAALARLEVLLGWPRGLGDPRREASIDALDQMLRRAGAERVDRQPLHADDPTTGRSYALVNLFGHMRPQAPRRFVLATHFDTRPWADEDPDPDLRGSPVPGANDGTSGVAVLLELLPMLVDALPSEVGVTVILFDGEELGRPGHGGYCMGSRHFARQADTDPPWWLARAEFGLVLDMVGDRDLHLPVEPTSARNAPKLVDRLWTVAQRRGHPQFEARPGPFGILDDHAFLTAAGVPSVLIIDHDYAHWHTHRDTIDEVSAQSLAAVGDTVLHTLIDLAETPLSP